MAVSIGQVTVPTSGGGTAPAVLAVVPPGSTAIMSTSATNADVYMGLGTAVTSSNGCPLDPTGPTTISNPATGAPFTLYGVAGTGTHVVGYIVITDR